tara:strand:- start:362 stop:577 length:216 start_codon:yes stop_codon:yes gene_type:complete
LRIDEVLHLFTIIKEDIEDYLIKAKELNGKLNDHDKGTLRLLSQQLLNLKHRLSNLDELKAKGNQTQLNQY